MSHQPTYSVRIIELDAVYAGHCGFNTPGVAQAGSTHPEIPSGVVLVYPA